MTALVSFKAAVRIPDIYRTNTKVDDSSSIAERMKAEVEEPFSSGKLPGAGWDPIGLKPGELSRKYHKSGGLEIPDGQIHTCTIYKNGEIGFKPPTGDEVRFQKAPEIPVDSDYLNTTFKNPLLVMLSGANLTVYDPELSAGDIVEPKHFMEGRTAEANHRILESVVNGGLRDELTKGIFSASVWMDTSGKPGNAKLFTKETFEKGARFYAKAAKSIGKNTRLNMGAGLEWLADNPRFEGLLSQGLKGMSDFTDTYVQGRRDAIEFILALGENYDLKYDVNPIVTASPVQDGLGDAENIRILREIAHHHNMIRFPHLISHRLGDEFVPGTNWHTPEVSKGIIRFFEQGLKTSPPIITDQIDHDYESTTKVGGRMLTGDDKNYALLWLYGAYRQLEKFRTEDSTTVKSIGGRHYVDDQNVHGLLGNTGLDPERMLVAIIELSKFYHAEASSDSSTANTHLGNYLALTMPYTGASFYSFFGYRKTPFYIQSVETAQVIHGLLNRDEGKAAPHRRAPDDTRFDGGLFAHMVLASGKEAGELAEIVQKNPNGMFELAAT